MHTQHVFLLSAMRKAETEKHIWCTAHPRNAGLPQHCICMLRHVLGFASEPRGELFVRDWRKKPIFLVSSLKANNTQKYLLRVSPSSCHLVWVIVPFSVWTFLFITIFLIIDSPQYTFNSIHSNPFLLAFQLQSALKIWKMIALVVTQKCTDK